MKLDPPDLATPEGFARIRFNRLIHRTLDHAITGPEKNKDPRYATGNPQDRLAYLAEYLENELTARGYGKVRETVYDEMDAKVRPEMLRREDA